MSQLDDRTTIYLIDYEYGFWNPKFYDLGNYLNELICDNAHPKPPYIKYYFENWPANDEIEYLTRQYVLLEKSDATDFVWSMDREQCEECFTAVHRTKQAMILNNYYWAVWAVMMMTEAEETDPEAYQWEFLEGRCEMHRRLMDQFGFASLF